jgi:hypothetical protein
MANKYLNDTGLQYFFNKLKTLFLTNVAYDSTNKKLTKTLNGTTSDIVTIATIKSAMSLSKSDVGLGNVDNTADANKSVRSAGTAGNADKLTTERYLEGFPFNGTAGTNYYATCPTAAATATKVATIKNVDGTDLADFTLQLGTRVFVKFTYANSVAGAALNVNGTGGKPMYYNGSAIAASVTDANGTYEFVYNGNVWELVGDLDTNTSYTNASLGQGYGTCSTDAATAAKAVTLSSYALTTNGIVSVKFTNAVPANATMNINSKGAKAIYYKGAAITDGIINAGDTATFIYNGTNYHLLAIDRKASGNMALGFFHTVDSDDDVIAQGLTLTLDGAQIAQLQFGNDLLATSAAPGLFSAAEKTKLAGIAAGANKTTVDSSLSSSSTNPVQNKVINTALGNKANLASPTFTGTPKAPTATAGTNTDQIATTAFVKSAVDTAIAGVTQFDFQVVTSLPATGVKGIIYLVAHSHGTGDAYDEYIWTGSAYEKIGNTDIDLSGYMLKTDMVAITTAEIDTLFA